MNKTLEIYFAPGTLIVLLLLLASCRDHPSNQQKTNTGNIPAVQTDSNLPVTGERIKGPANITLDPDGSVLFFLNDSTPVACTEVDDGWYKVGIHMEIPNAEYGIDTLKKGRDIIVDGEIAGRLLTDVRAVTLTTDKKTWAELTGFTQKQNIYEWSIIEKALSDFMIKNQDRSLEAFRPFIRDFALEPDTVWNFESFFNYENWIDDPSPLLRIQLLFESGRLAGVVHSRPLSLPGARDYPMERGFHVLFYEDTEKQKKQNFIAFFNEMINSVD